MGRLQHRYTFVFCDTPKPDILVLTGRSEKNVTIRGLILRGDGERPNPALMPSQRHLEREQVITTRDEDLNGAFGTSYGEKQVPWGLTRAQVVQGQSQWKYHRTQLDLLEFYD